MAPVFPLFSMDFLIEQDQVHSCLCTQHFLGLKLTIPSLLNGFKGILGLTLNAVAPQFFPYTIRPFPDLNLTHISKCAVGLFTSMKTPKPVSAQSLCTPVFCVSSAETFR